MPKDLMAGYSGTPLARKLGIKPGHRVLLRHPPDGFAGLLEPLPDGVNLMQRAGGPVDVIVAFLADRRSLASTLPGLPMRMRADGGLWLAWPKKSSPLFVDLAFDGVQQAGLATGLVDNKVCAIDDDYSGLRFVVRKGDRADWPTR